LLLQNPQPSDRELAHLYGPRYFIGSADDSSLAAQFELVKSATARLQLDEIEAYFAELGRSSNGLRLLEIGCGHGNLLLEAKRRGYKIQGLEYSGDAAAVANQKLGYNAVQVGDDTSTANFPEHSFDICILADVIEHVRDPRRFLEDIWPILDRRAVIYIATPSLDSWSAKLMNRNWVEFKREHLFYFAPATIKRLLILLGFNDIKIGAGTKILTLDYVIGHFEKFPVPFTFGAMHLLRLFIPSRLRQMKMKITASGMSIYATKP
jgi:SAM-dependent methyltransferase